MTLAYKYRCPRKGTLMIDDKMCRERRKFSDRLPTDIRLGAEKCRDCPGAEKLKAPIPIDHVDTPTRSGAAFKAPRNGAADNRPAGGRKPDSGPGPESAGPGNTNEPTPGERGSTGGPGESNAPAAASLPDRVWALYKNAWASLAACVEAGDKKAARDHAAALCVFAEILRLLNRPHGDGAKTKGEKND